MSVLNREKDTTVLYFWGSLQIELFHGFLKENGGQKALHPFLGVCLFEEGMTQQILSGRSQGWQWIQTLAHEVFEQWCHSVRLAKRLRITCIHF